MIVAAQPSQCCLLRRTRAQVPRPRWLRRRGDDGVEEFRFMRCTRNWQRSLDGSLGLAGQITAEPMRGIPPCQGWGEN